MKFLKKFESFCIKNGIVKENGEINKLKLQLERIYEAYENKIYDNQTFLIRKQKIESEIEILTKNKKELEKNNVISKKELKTKIIKLHDMLKKYDEIPTIEEKNELLKSLIHEIVYTRKNKNEKYNLKISSKI